MSLEALVETITQKRDLVAQEKDLVNIAHPEVVRQKRGHINRAKEDLKQLFYDYRKEIGSRAAFILTTGSKSEAFAKTAQKSFGCFSSDAEILYKEISNQIPEPLYMKKSSSPSLFDHFSARFEDRALAIDIVGYPHLGFESKYKKMINSKEDLLQLMKKAFNDKIGSEVVGLDAIDRVAEMAVSEGYAGKTVPIVLHTQDEELVADLAKNLRKLTRNVFIVSVGDGVSEGIQNASVAIAKTSGKKSIEPVLVKIRENLL